MDDVRRYALRGIHLPARRIVLEVFLLRRNTRNLVGELNEIVAGALQDVRERWSLLRLKACDGEANRCEDDRKASIGPCTHAEPFSSQARLTAGRAGCRGRPLIQSFAVASPKMMSPTARSFATDTLRCS